jgi:hydrogenase maturation factor
MINAAATAAAAAAAAAYREAALNYEYPLTATTACVCGPCACSTVLQGKNEPHQCQGGHCQRVSDSPEGPRMEQVRWCCGARVGKCAFGSFTAAGGLV